MGNQDIQLDGSEVTIIKAIGIHGEATGQTLIERCPDLETAELIDTLKGLMMRGFVDADDRSFYKAEELEPIHFSVNSGYAKEIKEALNPQPKQAKSKRVRRE